MEKLGSQRSGHGGAELLLVVLGFWALTILVTYPLAANLGSLAYRYDNNDGQFSVWNVAWIAHALTTDPRHLFDANIFYPHRWTLAYSEMNLAAGFLATPVYLLTQSAYAAHNWVLLLAFVMSGTGMYYLSRYLTGDRRAAIAAGIAFSFCPHIFAHLLHIQLLMTAGIPFSLLAFHRLADRPGAGRGAALGLVMAAQAVACAYYSVFVMILIGFAVLWVAAWEKRWTDVRYLQSIGVAAVFAALGALVVVLPYLAHHENVQMVRPIEMSAPWSADWRAYLASSAYAHSWMLKYLERWREVLFPGFVATLFGIVGLAAGWRSGGRARELVSLYGAIAALSFWESFGPDAGLYELTYNFVPGMNFLRAPSRFGLLVTFTLAVLAAFGIAAFLKRTRPAWVAATITIFAVTAEAFTPLSFTPVPPVDPAYQMLATLPRAPVLELPLYSNSLAFKRATYMLSSTNHWMPLVNAYSDYVPPDLIENADMLGEFPTAESLRYARANNIRYAVMHRDIYGGYLGPLVERLHEFAPYIRRVYKGDRIWIYEVMGAPDELTPRAPDLQPGP